MTPLELKGLYVGQEYEVVVTKAGYRTERRKVDWGGRAYVTLEMTLEREARRAPVSRPRPRARPRQSKDEWGYLTVGAVPWGKVYVDRRIVAAETPLMKGKVKPGRHSVKVYYPTLKKFSKAQTVQVNAGEVKKLIFRD